MEDARQMTAKTRNTVWVKYLLIALIVEKSIQHILSPWLSISTGEI